MAVTVLIVEDDEDTCRIYRDSLEHHGYRVLTASQGAEGVAIARRERPNLILLDIRMPIMDGRQAMRYLKADPQTSHIPIFGISAYFSPDQAPSRSGPFEFDQFLMKPLDPEAVVAAAEQRIGPPTHLPRQL